MGLLVGLLTPFSIGVFIFASYYRFVDAGYCDQYYTCQGVSYQAEKFLEPCSFWKWGKCTKYRQIAFTSYLACRRSICCPGYIGSSCSQAVCNGSTSCDNGGTCERPNYCSCGPGFASPACRDINECLVSNGGCDHFCTNTHGSFVCNCRYGFTLGSDGKSCTDYNECLVKNGGCEQTCKNTEGSFECQCTKGFTIGNDGKTCSDTNECLLNNGGCHHLCMNEEGSYHCECNLNYKLAADGRSCIDIDECAENSKCSQICKNTIGSYICSCRPGYILGMDGKSCQDIDDCVEVNCLNGGSCVDLVDEYTCKCTPWYEGSHCENDMNECLFLNGGCDEICINTYGSFRCECSNRSNLNADWKTCTGYNIGPSVFEIYKIPHGLLPRGCDYIELISCQEHTETRRLKLSSTSSWYNAKTNSSILYTFGIVFMEIDGLSLPVSITGLEVISVNNLIEWKPASPRFTENDGALLHNKQNECVSISFTYKDIQQFIATFLPTVFYKLQDILPEWIRFGTSGTGILPLTDLKTDLVFGRDLNSLEECKGAPISEERVYSVFRFATPMTITLYGNTVNFPAPLKGKKICIIIDICQDLVGTVYIMLPPESRELLKDFAFFKTLFERNFAIRPTGIGLSLGTHINVHYKTKEIQLWNGDDLFMYRVSSFANVWMLTDVDWKLRSEHIGLDVTGSVEIFLSTPNLSKLLTGIFVDEWNGLVHLKDFRATPVLKLKLFNQNVSIDFKDFATASFEAYFSIGGLSDRLWCGNGANPQGLFVSFMADVNPFRNIPFINDWLFDVNVRVYAFFATSPDNHPKETTKIDIFTDIVNLRDTIQRTGQLINAFIESIGDTLNKTVRLLFNDLAYAASFLSQKISDILQMVVKGNFQIENAIDSFSEIWKIFVRHFETTGRKIINAFEFETDIMKTNISKFIENEELIIQKNINLIVNKITNQVFAVVKQYSGFGLKFSAYVKILGYEFALMDVELVHSVEQLGQCSKYHKVWELMKGERSVKFLARATTRKRLGYFFTLERSYTLSCALSVSSSKFIVQFHAHVSILGIRVSADIFIRNNMLYTSIEGNIWNIYVAELSISAEGVQQWNSLALDVKGKLVVKNGENDFGGSYLDGLRMLTQQLAEKANERLTAVQNELSSVQRGLSFAQQKITDAQAKVWECNSAFDNAIRSMEKAKSKLEEAKEPFRAAVDKLTQAQKILIICAKLKLAMEYAFQV